MEGKFDYTNMDNESRDNDNKQQHILQIKKYDSRSQIFNDNDSFIAIEEQAMREDAEGEIGNRDNSINQEIQSEIEQLRNNLNEAIDEKRDALNQIALKDSEIEKLNSIIQDLKTELQSCKDKNSIINKELSEQRGLNSGLSLRLQELTEALNDKNKSSDLDGTIKNQPDQLIYRTRALELQLASKDNEIENLKEEIENREKHFKNQINRLTQEISNAHAENSNNKSAYLSNSSDQKLLEAEIAALRSQLDTMNESQKSLTDSLQHEIDTNSRLNSELSTARRDLEKNVGENANNSSVINNLLEITNLSNPFDLIINVRRLQAEKAQAHEATQQLCQLQISYDKELIINEKLRKELSALKDRFLDEMANKNKDIERESRKETTDSYFDQNLINDLKSDYESRLTAERERTSSQKKKIDAIRARDKQIAEKFASVPERDQTDMIQSLISIFESLSANSNSIGDSNSDDIVGINDHLLNSAIEEAQEIALKLIPHDFLFHAVDKMQLYQKYLNEIFAKMVEFTTQFKNLDAKVELLQRFARRASQKGNQFQRMAKMPISSRFSSKGDVTILRNTNNAYTNAHGDNTFNFNLNPNHSSLSFSRSPVAGGATPKSGARKIPFAEKGNGITPSELKWKPRSSPSNDFGPPPNLF